MAYTFVKLSTEIVTSTIWAEEADVLKVWVWMLAMADRNGVVRATVPAVALQNRLSVARAEEIIAKFLSPDKFSSNPANEGRRLEALPGGGGWNVLNYKTYRDKKGGDPEWQRERHARNQRQHWARKKGAAGEPQESGQNDRSAGQTDHQPGHETVILTTDAYTDTDTKEQLLYKHLFLTEDLGKGKVGSLERSNPDHSKPTRKVAGTFPVVGDQKGDEPVYQDELDRWKVTFPAVDVLQELREFKNWILADLTRRKTRRGLRRAIHRWLSTEQDKASARGGKNGFNRSRQSVAEGNLAALRRNLQELGESGEDEGGDRAGDDGALDGARTADERDDAGGLSGGARGPEPAAAGAGVQPSIARGEVLSPAGPLRELAGCETEDQFSERKAMEDLRWVERIRLHGVEGRPARVSAAYGARDPGKDSARASCCSSSARMPATAPSSPARFAALTFAGAPQWRNFDGDSAGPRQEILRPAKWRRPLGAHFRGSGSHDALQHLRIFNFGDSG